jgi:hypothetical protein
MISVEFAGPTLPQPARWSGIHGSVSDLEALGFEGVRRMELSPVCGIAEFSICGGVDQDKWWRVMS